MVLAADEASYRALVTKDYDNVILFPCKKDEIVLAVKLVQQYVMALADSLLGCPRSDNIDQPQSEVTPLDLHHQRTACARPRPSTLHWNMFAI